MHKWSNNNNIKSSKNLPARFSWLLQKPSQAEDTRHLQIWVLADANPVEEDQLSWFPGSKDLSMTDSLSKKWPCFFKDFLGRNKISWVRRIYTFSKPWSWQVTSICLLEHLMTTKPKTTPVSLHFFPIFLHIRKFMDTKNLLTQSPGSTVEILQELPESHCHLTTSTTSIPASMGSERGLWERELRQKKIMGGSSSLSKNLASIGQLGVFPNFGSFFEFWARWLNK